MARLAFQKVGMATEQTRSIYTGVGWAFSDARLGQERHSMATIDIRDTPEGLQATDEDTPALIQPRRTLADKLFYGLGSIAFGVKDNGFAVLLLLFYNQALGVSASAVGFAIMIALIIDAVCDPLIGQWSDSVRSRLGRRHPFMYAAAIPVAVSYYFLWNPPGGMSTGEIFWYLLGISVVIRIFISLYEIPSSALVVDMSRDYDERTSFLSYRYFFGWLGGLTMGIAAFSLFLRPSPSDPSGQLNLEGYSNYGLMASIIMLAAIVISSLGTQRHVASFAPPPPKRPFVFSRSFWEVWGTLINKPFLLLFFSTLFSYAAAGIGGAALTYFRIYFWELTGDQISFLMVGNFASIGVALVFAPRFSAWLGKKRAAITIGLTYAFAASAMYYARVLDILPPNGSSLLYGMLFVSSFINTVLAMSGGIVGSSLLADVVEHSEVRTGRHAAGLLFSANAFILKAISGIGVFGAGLILTFVSFPDGAKQGEVSADVLIRLGITEPTVVLLMSLIATLLIVAFPITRQVHEDNLRKLSRQSEN